MATNTIKVDTDQIFDDLEVMLWVVRIRREPSLVHQLNVSASVGAWLLAAADIVQRIHQERQKEKRQDGDCKVV